MEVTPKYPVILKCYVRSIVVRADFSVTFAYSNIIILTHDGWAYRVSGSFFCDVRIPPQITTDTVGPSRTSDLCLCFLVRFLMIVSTDVEYLNRCTWLCSYTNTMSQQGSLPVAGTLLGCCWCKLQRYRDVLSLIVAFDTIRHLLQNAETLKSNVSITSYFNVIDSIRNVTTTVAK